MAASFLQGKCRPYGKKEFENTDTSGIINLGGMLAAALFYAVLAVFNLLAGVTGLNVLTGHRIRDMQWEEEGNSRIGNNTAWKE